MKYFISFDVSDEAKATANNIIEQYRKPDDGIDWISPDKLHVTFLFLGSQGLSEDQVKEVRARFIALGPVFARTEGVGYFGPRVAFLSVRVPQSLMDMRMSLKDILPKVYKWNPHLTLGKNPDNGQPMPKIAHYSQGESFLVPRLRLVRAPGGGQPHQIVDII